MGRANVVGPGEGRRMPFGVVKVPQDTLGGALFIFEGTIRPGQVIPPHTHSREDEVTYVLDGTLTVTVGEETHEAVAGSCSLKPRGVPHTLANRGDRPVRVLEIHSPGGLEPYYDELGRLFSATDMEPAERGRLMTELQTRYGITFHGATEHTS